MKRCVSDLNSAECDINGHLAWANFCSHFKLGADLLVRIGCKEADTRRTAYRTRKMRQSDEVLKFVDVSRGHFHHPEQHGREDMATGRFQQRKITVGADNTGSGGMAFSLTKNISITNCSFNGRLIENLTIEDTDTFVPDEALKDIVSVNSGGFFPETVLSSKGKVFSPPHKTDTGCPYLAVELAEYAFSWFNEQRELLFPPRGKE